MRSVCFITDIIILDTVSYRTFGSQIVKNTVIMLNLLVNVGSAIDIGGPSIGNGMLFASTGISHGPIGSLVAFGKPWQGVISIDLLRTIQIRNIAKEHIIRYYY